MALPCWRLHSLTTALASPPAGSPPSNATFTCDVRAGLCFSVSARSVTATYFNARAACTTLGGDLVMYTTAEKQSFVESYLAGQGTLPKVGRAALLLLRRKLQLLLAQLLLATMWP